MKIKLENLATKYSELKLSDGLYLPDFEHNLYKLRNTFEEILGVSESDNSLLKYSDIKKLVYERGCEQPRIIVHFTVDSMGLNQLIKKGHFFEKYRENNEIIELSSLFPTITSTIMTSIHLGLPPEEHGILGHKIRFPEIGAVVNTLVMNVINAEDGQKDSLVRCGVDPKSLLWKYFPTTYYNSENYKQINLLQFDIAMTGLSHLMIEPESVISFKNHIDGIEKLKLLLKRKEKMYIHYYIADIDDNSHIYGPFSEQYDSTSEFIEFLIKKFIKSVGTSIADEIMLTITADHGQNTLDEDKVIYFDNEEKEEFSKYLIAPMGKSGRVIHFYVKEDRIEEFKEALHNKIGDGGLILTKYDNIRPLFASDKNLDRIFQRLGNVFVILKPNYSIERKNNQKEENEFIEFKMKGTHGSLSLDELIVPLFLDKISNYKKYC